MSDEVLPQSTKDAIMMNNRLLRIIQLEERVRELEGSRTRIASALVLVAAGHCDDKRLHYNLPYDGRIWCECGYVYDDLTDDDLVAPLLSPVTARGD